MYNNNYYGSKFVIFRWKSGPGISYKIPVSLKIYTMDSTKQYYDQFDIQSNLNLEMVDSAIILDLLSKTNILKALF